MAVVVRALAGPQTQHRPLALAVGVDGEGAAALHGAEDADEPRTDAVASGDVTGEAFLAPLVVEGDQGPARVSGGALDTAQAGGDVGDVALEVLQEDALVPEGGVHATDRVQESFGAAPAEAVEARQTADDLRAETP